MGTQLSSGFGAGTRHVQTLARLGLGNVGPGWFTSVMGTGILAVCLTISPVPIPFGHHLAIALWSADTILFATLMTLWIVQMLRAPASIAASLNDGAKAQLWGAPPMAAFTISVGFLKIGTAFIDPAVCILAAQILWIAGVAGSIFSAFLVPYLMFTAHEHSTDRTFGSWLLPIVPPIVASVPAAILSPTWPAALRGDMLGIAYGLLGIGVILAAIIIVLFYGRLVYHKVPAAPLVPTMWIVVGPLGQSVAGINALGAASHNVWPQFGNGLALAGVIYGVLVWGFAMYWLALAIAVTLRAVRTHLPFSLGWWAFTFPVGVLTAGTDALYTATHATLFAGSSLLLLALLAGMWSLVAVRTLRTAFATTIDAFESAVLTHAFSRRAA
ncbi:MAG: TDT family transporter [Candidatus Velthaea sp.]